MLCIVLSMYYLGYTVCCTCCVPWLWVCLNYLDYTVLYWVCIILVTLSVFYLYRTWTLSLFCIGYTVRCTYPLSLLLLLPLPSNPLLLFPGHFISIRHLVVERSVGGTDLTSWSCWLVYVGTSGAHPASLVKNAMLVLYITVLLIAWKLKQDLSIISSNYDKRIFNEKGSEGFMILEK